MGTHRDKSAELGGRVGWLQKTGEGENPLLFLLNLKNAGRVLGEVSRVRSKSPPTRQPSQHPSPSLPQENY